MPRWEVWIEGYAATGDRGTATYQGTFDAPTFKDACDQAYADPKHRALYNPDRLTYWGCRLFDNEADARKAFG